LPPLHTPKSTGEYIGEVQKSEYNYFTYNGKELHNGDGVIIVDEGSREVAEAFKINLVDENKVFPAEKIVLAAGQSIYRNYDYLFENQLKKISSQRKIAVKMCIEETEDGFVLHLSDERGVTVSQKLTFEKIVAEKKEEAKNRLQNELSKMGNTIYQVVEFEDFTKDSYFIPASVMGNWRREAVGTLDEKTESKGTTEAPPLPNEEMQRAQGINSNISYLQNVHNERAAAVYRELGVENVVYSFEKQRPKGEVAVMFCRYCIKRALGCCSQKLPEPLFLVSGDILFRLEFDCNKCEMQLYLER
jgi:putative protease